MLRRPLRRRMPCNVDPQNFSPIETEQHKAVKNPKSKRRDGKEIARGDVLRMVCEEGRRGQTPMSQGYVLLREFRFTVVKFETLFFYMQRVTKGRVIGQLESLDKRDTVG